MGFFGGVYQAVTQGGVHFRSSCACGKVWEYHGPAGYALERVREDVARHRCPVRPSPLQGETKPKGDR